MQTNLIKAVSLLLALICSSTQVSVASDVVNLTLANVDGHLKHAESQFPDIVNGTEKHIRWHHQNKRKESYSIVYIHGFSASGKEVSPMIELLADKLQANLYYSRLQGHGRSSVDAMGEADLKNWKQEALDALNIGKLIGDKTILIGTSTGGTLITWLNAQKQAAGVHATIMISPNFAVKNRLAGLMQWSWLRWIIKKTQGEYRSFQPLNDYHATYWTTRYPVDALLPMLDLVEEVAELDKSVITTPQLAIYSPNDQIVDVEKTAEAMQAMTNAHRVTKHYTDTADPVQHLLAGMVSTEKQNSGFADLIIEFVTDLTMKASESTQ